MATKCVNSMVQMLMTVPVECRAAILGPLKTIGAKYREILAKHKETFVLMKADPQSAEACTYILDVIEGRT